MENTKFHNLCMAYGKAQQDFETFRHGCHFIAVDVVKELKVYFEIPESQFSLYKINAQGEFSIVPPALINALTLKEDSFWQFGIGLTVCMAPETLPQELVLISILLRQDLGGKFYIKYANETNEFEIIKGNPTSFHPFFDFLHDTIIKTYNEQMQQFIGQSTTRRLGYKP